MRGLCFATIVFALGCGRVDLLTVTLDDASVDHMTSDSPSCTPGSTSCNGKCVDLATNNDNCGSCGLQCGNAALCMAGKCVPCPTGFSVCSGKCVDLVGDAKNCGKCANACPDQQVCAIALCSTSCPIGRSKCGMSCVDVLTDPSNCGGCNIACTNNQMCLGGLCCNAGEELCNGKCTNTQTDLDNCGGCNKKCAGKCKNSQCCQVPPIGSCTHALCDEGIELVDKCDVDGCVSKICAQDGFCCDAQGSWDSVCVDEVDQYCSPYSCLCQ